MTSSAGDIRARLARRSEGARSAFMKWPLKLQVVSLTLSMLLLLDCFGAAVFMGLSWQALAALNLSACFAIGWTTHSLMRQIFRGISDSGALEMQLRDLSRHSREVALLGELAEMLQACTSTGELCKIVSAFAQELFPATSGALHIFDSKQLTLELRSSWGSPPPPISAPFGLDDCWSTRRGKPHYREDPHEDLYCVHVGLPLPAFTFCVPLIGQGSTLGLLHLRAGTNDLMMSAPRQLVAIALAYQAALGLSNLKLKEILREEAIRDPVTGLFNRRFMQESLEHEIQRAQRIKTSVGVIALDLDHFKEANDTLGHAAGDALLQGLSKLVKGSFRSVDICCRQGGDEFLLVMPDITEGDALTRAEGLRRNFDQLTRDQFPALAGIVTLSAGVAMYPADAPLPDSLLKSADQALYRAKVLGRNRVFAASRLGGAAVAVA